MSKAVFCSAATGHALVAGGAVSMDSPAVAQDPADRQTRKAPSGLFEKRGAKRRRTMAPRCRPQCLPHHHSMNQNRTHHDPEPQKSQQLYLPPLLPREGRGLLGVVSPAGRVGSVG